MATAPQIEARDGTYTPNLVLTTNAENLFVTGTVEANTIDIQVSVNGAAFVSDPTLVSLNGVAFSVPNQASYPEGLTLNLGINTIALRAIDLAGGVSPVSTAQVTRVQSVDQADQFIPTGIRIRRRRDNVDVLAAAPSNTEGTTLDFRGFNFYASTSPGGTSGRFKINGSRVTEVSIEEEDIIEIEKGTAVFTPSTGSVVRTVVTEEDSFGQVLQTVVNKTTDITTITVDLKFEDQLYSRDLTRFVPFRHNRAETSSDNTINSDQFVDVDAADPLYYTVTSVLYDPAQGLEFETPHSQEVLGSPLTLDTNIRDLPGRTQIQIVTDYVKAIQRVNAEISLIPGSTTRDVNIDPFASETERVWFLVDFVHRSQSFLTLLQIDDANNDGVSDSVAGSSYKQALKAAVGLQTDTAVQNLIDTQFEKLAGNFTKKRLSGRPAVGQVIYFTATRPKQDTTIPSGAVVSTNADPDNGLPAARYVVGGTFLLPVSDVDAYFNFDTQQYEITVDVTAQSPGSSGNRPAGQIKNVVSGVSGLSVINREATTFGNDRESNTDLAIRSQLGFLSVDAGTEGGYAATAAETVGIVKNMKCGGSISGARSICGSRVFEKGPSLRSLPSPLRLPATSAVRLSMQLPSPSGSWILG
jgi:hypothetical protein